jgi:hypothetical protein
MTRRVLAVLGMHRSGTSALTGAIAGCGFALGMHLVPPAPDNPSGYFENATAVDINDELLLALGRGWDDLRPLPAGWQAGEAASLATRRIAAWLRDEFAQDDDIVLKDPRLCVLFPLWRSAFLASGIVPSVVLATRPVSEVVASLATRDDLDATHASLLWLKHMLGAEHASRGLVRTAVSYDHFVLQPVIELDRCLSELGAPKPGRDVMLHAVAAVDQGKRHHRAPTLDVGDSQLLDCLAEVERLLALPNAPSARFDEAQVWLDRRLSIEAVQRKSQAVALNRCRRESRANLAHAQEAQQGLEVARSLAMERLDQLHQLSESAEAVSELASRRLAEVEAIDQKLAVTDAALASVAALAEGRLGEIVELDRRLGEASTALDVASALADTRLGEIVELDRRLGEASTALDVASALADTRLGEIVELDRRLGEASTALDVASALADTRLGEIVELDGRLSEADAAIEAASAIARSRLEEMQSLDERLRQAGGALSRAESLAESRLSDILRLDGQLQAVASALASAESLAESRLVEVRALDSRLRLADEGLSLASRLAETRLSEIQGLDLRLQQSDAALSRLERLAVERLELAEALDRQVAEEREVRGLLEVSISQLESSVVKERAALVDAVSALHSSQASLDLANERAASLQARIEAMEMSFSWRLTRPLRWLVVRWRALGA